MTFRRYRERGQAQGVSPVAHAPLRSRLGSGGVELHAVSQHWDRADHVVWDRGLMFATDAPLPTPVDDDGAALAELLRKHGPQVRRRITGQIAEHFRSAVDEDDVMQVTYLEAFLQADRFTARDSGSFLAWLTRIAENNLRDAVKELSRAKRPPREKRVTGRSTSDSHMALLETLGSTITTASKQAEKREAKSILNTCTRRLPADYHEVVRLYDLESRPVTQVANIMGRSVGAVYMLRARALSRLRELLPTESKFFGG